jgi:hypothetical protein
MSQIIEQAVNSRLSAEPAAVESSVFFVFQGAPAEADCQPGFLCKPGW